MRCAKENKLRKAEGAPRERHPSCVLMGWCVSAERCWGRCVAFGQEPSERSSWCDRSAAKHLDAALVMSIRVCDINGAALPKLGHETTKLCWKLMVELVALSAERYPVCDVVSQARIDMSADNVRGVQMFCRAAVLAQPIVPLHHCSCPFLIFVHLRWLLSSLLLGAS
jgi:hypothetical protein